MKFQPSNLAIVLYIYIYMMRLMHITEDQIKKSVKMDWEIDCIRKTKPAAQ